MNHEMPPHLENEINDWYEGSIKRRLQEAFNSVQSIGKDMVPNEDEVKEIVINANKVIKEACNGEEDLYNYYRYRIFYQDQHYIIVWGDEVDLDEGENSISNKEG